MTATAELQMMYRYPRESSQPRQLQHMQPLRLMCRQPGQVIIDCIPVMSLAKKRPRSDIVTDYQELESAQNDGILTGLSRLVEKGIGSLKKLIGEGQQETLLHANRRHIMQLKRRQVKQHDPSVVARVEQTSKGFAPLNQSIKRWQKEAQYQESNLLEASLMKRSRSDGRESTEQPDKQDKRFFRFPTLDDEELGVQWHVVEEAFELELEKFKKVSQEQIEENAKDSRSLKERLFGIKDPEPQLPQEVEKQVRSEDNIDPGHEQASGSDNAPKEPEIRLTEKKQEKQKAQDKKSEEMKPKDEDEKTEKKVVNPFATNSNSSAGGLSLNQIIKSQPQKQENPLFKSVNNTDNKQQQPNSSSQSSNPLFSPSPAIQAPAGSHTSPLGPMIKKGKEQVKSFNGMFAAPSQQTNALHLPPQTTPGGMFGSSPSFMGGVAGYQRADASQVDQMFGKTSKQTNEPPSLFDNHSIQTKTTRPRSKKYRNTRDKGQRVTY